MSKNQFTGTATQQQCNCKIYQINKDQYCTCKVRLCKHLPAHESVTVHGKCIVQCADAVVIVVAFAILQISEISINIFNT